MLTNTSSIYILSVLFTFDQFFCLCQECLDSTAETASDVMLAATFGTKPTECIAECEWYSDVTGLIERFESILGNCLFFLEVCTQRSRAVNQLEMCAQIQGFQLNIS